MSKQDKIKENANIKQKFNVKQNINVQQNANVKKNVNVKQNVSIKKNDEFETDIIDYGTDGEGIAKIDGYTIFVKGALKGEKCKIHITKVLQTHAFANVTQILKKSPNRKESDCATFPRCGGCTLRHINYEETLKIKQEKVQNLFDKSFKKGTIKVEQTVGMEKPFYYRNKAIYPISQDKKVGIYASRSHNVVPINECKIQTIQSQEIAKYIIENWKDTIYDEKTGKGLLRNIMIRESFTTGEVMCVLVQNGTENLRINAKSSNKKTNNNNSNQYNDSKNENESDKGKITSSNLEYNLINSNLINNLVKKFPKIKTIIINVNKKNTNVVLSSDNIVVYGSGYITDVLGGYKFRISPNSFYQVNPIQTEKIYKMAIEKANLNENDVMCDLYCGIGTIGIFASKYVKKVYGIEIVPQAIMDAKENAKINNIKNIEFIEGNVEDSFDKLLNNKNGNNEISKNDKPNAVIVDPPRKGLDSTTIQNLKKLKLEKLVYVSCNPATLVRDLKDLSEVYEIKEVIPIDNFCFSSHVETIATLKLKN